MHTSAGATKSHAVKPSRDGGRRHRTACIDAALLISRIM
jgi:hypothetical protein